jgi:hypothetical protein
MNPEVTFTLMQTKQGTFLKLSFNPSGDYIPQGSPLNLRFADDHVLTIPCVKTMHPMRIASSWLITGIYMLDEQMQRELMTNDIKFIRVQTYGGNWDWPVEEGHKDAVKRFLTAINNR